MFEFFLENRTELLALLLGVIATATAVTHFVAPKTENTVDDKIDSVLSKVLAALKFLSLRLGK